MISWKYKRDFKRVLTANLFDSPSAAKYGKSDTTKKAKTRITFKLNSNWTASSKSFKNTGYMYFLFYGQGNEKCELLKSRDLSV